jgi:hypothetical protein
MRVYLNILRRYTRTVFTVSAIITKGKYFWSSKKTNQGITGKMGREIIAFSRDKRECGTRTSQHIIEFTTVQVRSTYDMHAPPGNPTVARHVAMHAAARAPTAIRSLPPLQPLPLTWAADAVAAAMPQVHANPAILWCL